MRAGTGAVRVLWAEGEPLSPAGGDAPAPAAERFINENGSLLGLEGPAAHTLFRTREDALMDGALTRVVFEQVVDGIPVFEGVVWAHVDRLGRVVKLASGLLHRGGAAEERKAAASLSAEGALQAAVANVQPEVTLAARRRSSGAGPDRRTVFEHGSLRSDVPVSLVWFPTSTGDRLAWRVRVEPEGLPQIYDVLVDAQDGSVLYRRNLVRYADGAGRVPQSDETQLLDARRPDENPAGSSPAGPADPPNGCPPVSGYASRSLAAPFRDPASVLADGGRLRGNNVTVYKGAAGVFGALGTLTGERGSSTTRSAPPARPRPRSSSRPISPTTSTTTWGSTRPRATSRWTTWAAGEAAATPCRPWPGPTAATTRPSSRRPKDSARP